MCIRDSVGTALSIFLIMLVVMMQQVKVAPFSPESTRNRFLHVHYMSISHKAVSYTHLDVYKRQARRYYLNIVGKYGPQVQALLKKAAALDLSLIHI